MMVEEYKVLFYIVKIDELFLCEDVDLVCVFCLFYVWVEVVVKVFFIGKYVFCDFFVGFSKDEVERMV